MTRDENEGDLSDVIETLIGYARNSRIAAYNEGFDAGKAMLKLDEPKSAEQRAIDLLDDRMGGYDQISAAEVINILAANGLKIVEN